jgi:hypothetical protein
MYAFTLATACALTGASLAAEASRVRHVQVKGDEIAVVKTAVGVATLIQLPDKPSSVVVGDQGAFKVEYLDQGLAIKPLHGSAKSNLYIYTDWRRFSVQLVTGAASGADYVVYLEALKSPPKLDRTPVAGRDREPSVQWKKCLRIAKGGGLLWRVTGLGAVNPTDPAFSMRMIRFELSASSSTLVNPEGFWLTQGGRVRPLQRLILSDNRIASGGRIHGVIQIRRADLMAGEAIQLEIRRRGEKTLTLALPEEGKWK